VRVINLLLALGAGVLLILVMVLAHISLWLAIPSGLAAGVGLFIWLGRKVQGQLEGIFTRAAELMKKQKFDQAIAVMKEGYAFSSRQFLVKGSIDGQIGMVQYLRSKHDEAEPLLRSASLQHYVAKAMLGVLLWKRGEKKAARETFALALKTGKKESLLYAVYAYVLNEMGDRTEAIEVLNKGLKACGDDDRLLTNRNLLQNGKPLKMKVYGEQWYQFMIERPMLRQEPPPYARISRKAMRG
jgi:tetratricopeptide (TPR) repeat protein